jgi:hypothetical protein
MGQRAVREGKAFLDQTVARYWLVLYPLEAFVSELLGDIRGEILDLEVQPVWAHLNNQRTDYCPCSKQSSISPDA